MRAVIQRVKKANVSVDGKVIGEIGHGLLIFLGVGEGDTEADMKYIADKSLGLRIFTDENDKMNLSVCDVGGGILVISQFTLYGDCRKGRRPSFTGSMEPAGAEELYEKFIDYIAATGISVGHGEFGADMNVELINDGPVTMLLDSSRIL
ncbi:MAG: D-tyrosyl-tRNA(Tyr) deacylase [Clostridia bacterium]|nr:D-tyrosyl-tRNA(Tyr) deacylase [Clostridia bacterium]